MQHFRRIYQNQNVNLQQQEAMAEAREKRMALHAIHSQRDSSTERKKKKAMIGGRPAAEFWAQEKRAKLDEAAARQRFLKRAFAGIDKSQSQPENYLMKVATRDQANQGNGKPQGTDAGRYNPIKPTRLPYIADFGRGGGADRGAFLPKAQYDENPAVSCCRLSHELDNLRELIQSPSKRINESLATLQRPKN